MFIRAIYKAKYITILRHMHLLGELNGDPDPEKSKRVTDAMLKMQKTITSDLPKAQGG